MRDELATRLCCVSNRNRLFKVKGDPHNRLIICGSPHLSNELGYKSRVAFEYEFMNLVFGRLLKLQHKCLDLCGILGDTLTFLPGEVIPFLDKGNAVVWQNEIVCNSLLEYLPGSEVDLV